MLYTTVSFIFLFKRFSLPFTINTKKKTRTLTWSCQSIRVHFHIL